MFDRLPQSPNYVRFRLSPDVVISLGSCVKRPGRGHGRRSRRVDGSPRPGDEMRAYERLLGEAVRGDPTLFVREDEVLAAWAIVEPALRAPSPVHEYEPGTWGPPEADALIAPDGGWNNPTVDAPVPVPATK